MADETLDADLQDLLNQLDDVSEDASVDDDNADGDDQQKAEDDAANERNDSSGSSVADLRPVDVRRLDEEAQSMQTVEESTVAAVDVKRYLDQLDEVTQDVLQACQSDRQEAQDVINLLRQRIDAAINSQRDPQRMYVDGLVKAVEVKAGINATAVKMIEGVSKTLAATKAGLNIQNNIQVSGSELDELLSQEMSDDLD